MKKLLLSIICLVVAVNVNGQGFAGDYQRSADEEETREYPSAEFLSSPFSPLGFGAFPYWKVVDPVSLVKEPSMGERLWSCIKSCLLEIVNILLYPVFYLLEYYPPIAYILMIIVLLLIGAIFNIPTPNNIFFFWRIPTDF